MGEAVMVSGFVSDATGGHPVVMPEDIQRANEIRESQDYISSDAIMTARDNIDKKKHPLTMEQFEQSMADSPFLMMFRHGASHERYWNGNKMKIQFEDAVDMAKAMFPGHDFLFLFDQSSGHTKKKGDGLDVSVMNESHVQKTPIELRPSKLTEDCIGPFRKEEDGISKDKLVAGNTQVFTWPESADNNLEEEDGPFYLLPQERLAHRVDVAVQSFQSEDESFKNTIELKRDLAQKGIDFIMLANGLVALQQLAEANGVPLKSF
jgi:hypothetical protein